MQTTLITAFGSSGTGFLASTLARSQYVIADHEGNPKRHRHKIGIEAANKWYHTRAMQCRKSGKTGYIDVNGHLRYRMLEYKVDKYAIILRDWRDILKSWAGHWGKGHELYSEQWVASVWAEIMRRAWLNHVQATVEVFTEYIESGMPQIHFSRMTTDINYLKNLCFEFGAIDVAEALEPGDLARKVNRHNPEVLAQRVERYEDIPALIREPFEALTNEFNKKYVLPYVD